MQIGIVRDEGGVAKGRNLCWGIKTLTKKKVNETREPRIPKSVQNASAPSVDNASFCA